MVYRVCEGAGIELLYLVEYAVKLQDTLFNLEPSLVHVTTIGNLRLVSEPLELILHYAVSLCEGVYFLVSFLHALHLVSRVDQNTISLVIVHMNVDISARDCLHLSRGPITEVLSKRNRQILFGNLKVLNRRKHCGVVVVQLRCLILQSHQLEALTTNVATMNGSLAEEVIHFLVRVRIIFDTWAHADDNTPRGVRSEYEYGIVDSSELRVNCGLHIVPLVHLESVVSNGSRQVSCSVTVKTVAIGQL